MDNRLRFLYCSMTEMWGHGQKVWAGNGKTGASRVGVKEANPLCRAEYVMQSETRVAKQTGCPSRKAAIVHAVPVP